MNHLNMFLNNRVFCNEVAINSHVATIVTDIVLLQPLGKLGNFCLTPVRYLFNGDAIQISYKEAVWVNETGILYGMSQTTFHQDQLKTITHKTDFTSRGFLRTTAAIILLIPGLIIGSAFKAISYLSPAIRENHRLAILHRTPVDKTLGSPEERLNLQEIKRNLQEVQLSNNPLNQPTGNLVIYARRGTLIINDPGIIALNPQKIILVGARLTGDDFNQEALDEVLAKTGEWHVRSSGDFLYGKNSSATIMNVDGVDICYGDTFIPQWEINSVEQAVKDIPPKRSFFGSERVKRLYTVWPDLPKVQE